jgi:hypothetical protein
VNVWAQERLSNKRVGKLPTEELHTVIWKLPLEYSRIEMETNLWSENPKGRDHLRD